MTHKTIEGFLKDKDTYVRLVVGTRWMYWDEINKQWLVQSRTHGQKSNRC